MFSLETTDGPLRWTLDRVHAAIAHAHAHAHLAGPLALRRTDVDSYTTTARLDVLDEDQRAAVLNNSHHDQAVTVEQANALLAALVFPRVAPNQCQRDEHDRCYHQWRADHLDTERELRATGVLHADHRPDTVAVNPEVLYSLRYRSTPTGF